MIDWSAISTIASVISAACALGAVVVSVIIWRQTRGADLLGKIEDGDMAAREHANREVEPIALQLSDMSLQMIDLRQSIARIETEQGHHLTARNLGPMHEKINAVSQDVSALRAENKASNEQITMLYNYVMKNLK